MSIELLLDNPFQKKAVITVKNGSRYELSVTKVKVYSHRKNDGIDPLVPFTFLLSSEEADCPLITPEIRGYITFAAETLSRHYPACSYFFAFNDEEKYQNVLELFKLFGPAHNFDVHDTTSAHTIINKWSHFVDNYKDKKIVLAIKSTHYEKYNHDWVNTAKL